MNSRPHAKCYWWQDEPATGSQEASDEDSQSYPPLALLHNCSSPPSPLPMSVTTASREETVRFFEALKAEVHGGPEALPEGP